MNLNNSYIEAVTLLKSLIAIPSISREEEAVSDFLQEYLKAKGFEPRRKNNNIYVLSKEFDDSRPTLLLNAHLDTVKPAAGWLTDPYVPIEKEGRIYGLGSNDDGASLVCLLATFMLLQDTKQAYNLIFLASAEEEISGKNGIESVLAELPVCSLAIVGEPTGMHPAVAEKGLMVLDCISRGVAGHAARNEGQNAIYKAIPDIEWFRNYTFPKVSQMLGAVKTTVTQINAGTQHNVVPAECTFVVDVRSNDCYSNQELYELIKANVDCEVKPRSFRLNSSHISLEHSFVQKVIQLGRKPFGSPTLSD
ncbi:MAG: M20/M25/M40 family metallo-hydrolase, partial [Bacteroidales bacterium]|nr:M20/M25/M40 family metallo-hydrolase [Bacteroidales bacterium]